jgi:hypothetical protein
MVARSPVTNQLPEIANPRQVEARNDNPPAAQGYQQRYYSNTFLNKGRFAVVKNENLKVYVSI